MRWLLIPRYPAGNRPAAQLRNQLLASLTRCTRGAHRETVLTTSPSQKSTRVIVMCGPGGTLETTDERKLRNPRLPKPPQGSAQKTAPRASPHDTTSTRVAVSPPAISPLFLSVPVLSPQTLAPTAVLSMCAPCSVWGAGLVKHFPCPAVHSDFPLIRICAVDRPLSGVAGNS